MVEQAHIHQFTEEMDDRLDPTLSWCGPLVPETDLPARVDGDEIAGKTADLKWVRLTEDAPTTFKAEPQSEAQVPAEIKDAKPATWWDVECPDLNKEEPQVVEGADGVKPDWWDPESPVLEKQDHEHERAPSYYPDAHAKAHPTTHNHSHTLSHGPKHQSSGDHSDEDHKRRDSTIEFIPLGDAEDILPGVDGVSHREKSHMLSCPNCDAVLKWHFVEEDVCARKGSTHMHCAYCGCQEEAAPIPELERQMRQAESVSHGAW